MKKLIYLLPALIVILNMCTPVTQKEQSNENVLMPDNQIVRYFSKITNDSIYNNSLKLYQMDNIDFTKVVFDKVLAGKVKVYENTEANVYNIDTAPIPMEINDLESKLGMHIQTINYTDDKGNEVTQKIKLDLVPEEITEVGFIEEWQLNADGFLFTKNVLAYNFVREYLKEESNEKRKLLTFTIIPNLDTIDRPEWQLVCSKAYEVKIEAVTLNEIIEYGKVKQEFWNTGNSIFNYRNPFWNSHTYTTLVDALFNNVEEGKVNTFDFNTKETISYSEIEDRMGATEMTITYQNEEGDEVTQTIKPDLIAKEIKSLIFIEDWYIEENSLALRKEIKGIAPVRYFMKGKSEDIIKQIPFVILYE